MANTNLVARIEAAEALAAEIAEKRALESKNAAWLATEQALNAVYEAEKEEREARARTLEAWRQVWQAQRISAEKSEIYARLKGD